MWNKREKDIKSYDQYLLEFTPPESQVDNIFPSYDEFLRIITDLPAWKGAGCDGIYNFFIKKCTSIHQYLYIIVKKTCMSQTECKDWFYKSITYLIPKGISTKVKRLQANNLHVKPVQAHNQMCYESAARGSRE